MPSKTFKIKTTGKTGVFIDAANIELSAKDIGFKIDYKKLLAFLKKQTNLSYIGFYTVRFNNEKHDAFLTFLKKTGYNLVTKPIKVIKKPTKQLGDIRKANFDVEITVEIMKRIKELNTIILFSGDSDFEYLVKELRKKRKIVIVVSFKHHISKELINSANYYFDLKKIRNIIERK
jgi:uncharacterized LabA/DUF88 family protein